MRAVPDEIKRLGGVDEVIFGHFTELRTMDWRDFIHKLLIGKFHAKYIISGHKNALGIRVWEPRKAWPKNGRKAGIGYDCIQDVKIDGVVVSSTYIRQLIRQGVYGTGHRNFWAIPIRFRHCRTWP